MTDLVDSVRSDDGVRFRNEDFNTMGAVLQRRQAAIEAAAFEALRSEITLGME